MIRTVQKAHEASVLTIKCEHRRSEESESSDDEDIRNRKDQIFRVIFIKKGNIKAELIQ